MTVRIDGGGTAGRAIVTGSDGVAEEAAFAPASSTHDHAGVYQPLDSDLTAIAANITAAGHALVDDADNAAQRTTLGLGTIATQAANNVAITGGSVTGITDIAVADGGTGASTAATARTNLGLSNTILHVANIAALKALDVSGIADETPYYVAGYTTQGDGGEGVFRYVATPVTTDTEVISATVAAGGTGYSVGDTITVSGGTSSRGATFKVATLSGSAVATVTLLYRGKYSVQPSNPVATTSTPGSGCTLTLSWAEWEDKGTIFSSSGAGQWLRQTEGTHVFHAAWYGMPTGSDDAPLINDIIDLADATYQPTENRAQCLLFGRGTYIVNTPIVFKRNFSLVGVGDNFSGTIFSRKVSSASNVFTFDGTNVSGGWCYRNSVDNILIFIEDATTTHTQAIYFYNSYSNRVTRVSTSHSGLSTAPFKAFIKQAGTDSNDNTFVLCRISGLASFKSQISPFWPHAVRIEGGDLSFENCDIEIFRVLYSFKGGCLRINNSYHEGIGLAMCYVVNGTTPTASDALIINGGRCKLDASVQGIHFATYDETDTGNNVGGGGRVYVSGMGFENGEVAATYSTTSTNVTDIVFGAQNLSRLHTNQSGQKKIIHNALFSGMGAQKVISASKTLFDGERVIVDTASVTLTLPASGYGGPLRQIEIINLASGTISLARGGSDTIEGLTSYTLGAGASVILQLPNSTTSWKVFPKSPGIIEVSGTSKTLTVADKNTVQRCTNGSATTITINTGIFAVGDTLSIRQVGAGVVSLAGTATASGSFSWAQHKEGILRFVDGSNYDIIAGV